MDCALTRTVRMLVVRYTRRTIAVVGITIVNTCPTILTRTASTQVQINTAVVSRVACCSHTCITVQRINTGASVLTQLSHTVIHQVPTCHPSVPHWAGAGELSNYTRATIFTIITAVICCTNGVRFYNRQYPWCHDNTGILGNHIVYIPVMTVLLLKIEQPMHPWKA